MSAPLLGRGLWGALLIYLGGTRLPERVPDDSAGAPVTGLTPFLVQFLGLRHLGQAGLEVLARRSDVSRARTIRRLSSLIDLAHVASLPVLALLVTPSVRRLIEADAPVELVMARLQTRSVHNPEGK